MDGAMSQGAPRPVEHDVDLEIELLLEAIVRKYSYEFRHYARASLRRRILGALTKLGFETVSMLQDRILRDPALFARLLTEMTVPVSDLFRDPEYFLALRRRVFPLLATYPSLRVWIAGCSTGEEVYSLAILLDETGLLDRSLIYATDINPQSLQAAEAGVYPLERVAGFTRNYQQAGGTRSLVDYYTAAYGGVVFRRELRKRVAFSDHSLATDHVFAEVQFVSCRNVLIYFDRDLQNRAIGLFADALVARGFLGLGTRESLRVTKYVNAFEEYAAPERIYRRVA
jgi:chemotaxis protein methyltransferase CheR